MKEGRNERCGGMGGFGGGFTEGSNEGKVQLAGRTEDEERKAKEK